MTTWRLLYENRFPSHAVTGATLLDVHRAATGTLSIQSGPVFTSFTGFPGFGIGDGRNLTYRPAAALGGVIGLDVAMEIAFLGLLEERPITLFSTDSVSATVTPTAPPAANGETPCRLTIRVADATITVEGLTFRHRFGPQPLERRRFQMRWTTNGQLQVFLDGQLIAYENAAKPGLSFGLARVSVGDVDRPMTAILNATVTNVRVIELREESALDSFGEQLDPGYVPEVSDRCGKVAQATLQQHLRAARALMARFNLSQTSAWRQPDGGTPFKPAALAVHDAGGKAGVAMGRYLRDGTAEARNDVLTHLKEVLTALAADQPDAFKALLVQIQQAQTSYYSECQVTADKIRAANPDLFKKLDPLHDGLNDLIQNLGARR